MELMDGENPLMENHRSVTSVERVPGEVTGRGGEVTGDRAWW
jgi:hypothetical protein